MWHGADWACPLGGRCRGLPAPGLVIGVIQMYFHFQLLTDCAALAAAHQGPGEAVDLRLLRWRTVQTVLRPPSLLAYGAEWLPEAAVETP